MLSARTETRNVNANEGRAGRRAACQTRSEERLGGQNRRAAQRNAMSLGDSESTQRNNVEDTSEHCGADTEEQH